MRSKEVDGMINSVLRDLDFYSTERLYIDRIILQNIVAYIEKLEKMIPTPSNEVPVEYQTDIWVNKKDAVMKSEIRDKIKELKDEQKSIQDKLSKNMLFSESEFYSFSEYTKWRLEINQKIKDINAKIEVLKSIIGE